MSTRTVARNTLFLSAAQGIRIVLAFALILYIANSYGPTWQGKFSILLAFLNIFQVMATFGLPRLITRNVARDYSMSNGYYWAGLTAQGLTTLAMMVVMAGVVAIMPYPPETQWMLWVAVLALPLFTLYSLAGALLRAVEKMQYLVYAEVFSAVAQLLTAILLLSRGGGVIVLAVIRVAGIGLAAFMVSIAVLHLHLVQRPRWQWQFSRRLLRESLSFFGMAGFDALTQRLDVLILSVVAGEAATGVYDAAFQLIKVVMTLVLSFTDAVYPAISRLFAHDRPAFTAALRNYLQWGVMALLPVAAGLTLLARFIIRLLYRRADYQAAGPVLQVLAWTLLVYFVYIFLSRALMAANRERVAFWVTAGMVAAGALLLAAGVQGWGPVGAAAGLLVMYGLGALLTGRLIARAW
jgi:O-antigen/teichoic acid export membrane protein